MFRYITQRTNLGRPILLFVCEPFSVLALRFPWSWNTLRNLNDWPHCLKYTVKRESVNIYIFNLREKERDRERKGGRERLICYSTNLHIHWLLLEYALTGDQTGNFGLWDNELPGQGYITFFMKAIKEDR